MSLEEESVTSRSDGRSYQGRDVLWVSSARASLESGPLDGVCAIEHGGRVGRGSKTCERAHVDDEVSISVYRSPFGDRDLRSARLSSLLQRRPHFFGSHPLPLLHIHGPSSPPGRDEEIRLFAEKSRDLEHVYDFSDRRGLVHLMDVREDG